MLVDSGEVTRATELAYMLSDPLRLMLLQALMVAPASVAELVAATRASQPNVSNHLKVLRERNLVRGTRQGRQVMYEVADFAVAQLVEALTAAAGGPPAGAPLRAGPLVEARTCYDHLAGRLGVALFTGLVAAGAIIAPDQPWGEVEPGPAARDVLGGILGLDLDAVANARGRRRFAFACPDWSTGGPHLGGVLGASIHQHLSAAGWIVRDRQGTRAVELTTAGAQALEGLLGAPGIGRPG